MLESSGNENVVVTPSNRLGWRKAREALVACYESHNVDAHCLGWLPRKVYDLRHEEGRIFVCHNNDDHVGHCMWVVTERIAKIYMTWVRPDARMILHGRALVDAIEKAAASERCGLISLWCAEDLSANIFWRAIGFTNTNWRYGRGLKPRRHLLWRRRIITPFSQQPAKVQAVALEKPPSSQRANLLPAGVVYRTARSTPATDETLALRR
jgi:GNAT superfamily N-acetyltransferase